MVEVMLVFPPEAPGVAAELEPPVPPGPMAIVSCWPGVTEIVELTTAPAPPPPPAAG